MDINKITTICLWVIGVVFLVSLGYTIYAKKTKKLFKNRRIIDSLPNIVSALGVIGTFLGITMGLMDFNPSPDKIDASISTLLNGLKTAVQFYALSYLVVWIDGTLSSYMTALEKPWHSLSISLLSTFVFPIIMLAVLVPFWGLDGVWILNFAAGILSATAAVIIVKKALKNIENVDLKLVTK